MTSVKKIKRGSGWILLFALVVISLRYFFVPVWIFPKKYQALVEKYAAQYQIDDTWVYAMIKAESNFDPRAISHKDARGLMQISLTTGQWAADTLHIENYTEEMLFDPEINIQIGCWYTNLLYRQFHENMETVLAAYNGGSGNVQKWLSNPEYSQDGITLSAIPFGETKRYVKKVVSYQKAYAFLY